MFNFAQINCVSKAVSVNNHIELKFRICLTEFIFEWRSGRPKDMPYDMFIFEINIFIIASQFIYSFPVSNKNISSLSSTALVWSQQDIGLALEKVLLPGYCALLAKQDGTIDPSFPFLTELLSVINPILFVRTSPRIPLAGGYVGL